MKNKNLAKILAAVMMMSVAFGAAAGCTQLAGNEEAAAESAGTLILKVNPEFEIDYNDEGNVMDVDAMNDDAEEIMKTYTAYEDKSARDVVTELVQIMDEEGYIEKDDKGEGKDINLAVKYGSAMPQEQFLQDIITGIKSVFDEQKVTGKVVVTGESNYEISEYEVSDYGDSNYKEVKTKITEAVSDGNSYTNYENTDYDGYNSDYGSETDYDGTNTDYDSNSTYDSDSKYDDADDDSSNYDTSNYDTSNYDSSNYDSNSSYDDSDYDD